MAKINNKIITRFNVKGAERWLGDGRESAGMREGS